MTDRPANPARAARLAGLVASVALSATAAGCGAGSWVTLDPASDFARMILDVYAVVLWWTLGILVVVEALLLFALWRFRRREGDPDVPDQVHGHTLLEIGWTLAPAAILFFIAIPTIRTIFQTQADPPQRDPLEVVVVGHQWWWEFEYPDLGIVTANELHIPRGRTVRLTLTSADVIHAFWAPRLGGKRDLNPGSENVLWFTPDSTGIYEGRCAELCGTSHANMRFLVFVDDREAFDEWVASFPGARLGEAPQDEAPQDTVPAPAATAAPVDTLREEPAPETGFQTFLTSGCAACHAIDGTVARGVLGPNLTNFGRRTTIAAGLRPNTPEHLAGWLRNPDSVKPGALMPDLNLSEEKIEQLVTYLESLR